MMEDILGSSVTILESLGNGGICGNFSLGIFSIFPKGYSSFGILLILHNRNPPKELSTLVSFCTI
jgi:hypothetical protein